LGDSLQETFGRHAGHQVQKTVEGKSGRPRPGSSFGCAPFQETDAAGKELEASSFATTQTRDRCYDFLNIFAEKIGVFDSKQS
jgi:hypothetical protein